MAVSDLLTLTVPLLLAGVGLCGVLTGSGKHLSAPEAGLARLNKAHGAAGGGVTAGYQWPLSRHWNLEASLGVGYDYIRYDKFKCGECGEKLKSSHANYFGPTKLAISVLYVF